MNFLESFLLAASVALSGPTAASSVSARVPVTAAAPVIDGVLDDAVWEQAAILPPFTGPSAKLYDRAEQTYLLYDDVNLYVGFRTLIDFDADVAFTPFAHDDPKLVTVDAFSMNFAKPGNPLCRQFNVERAGGTGDCLWDVSKGLGAKDFSWEGSYEVMVNITPGSFLTNYVWELEAAIPWTTLDMKPEPGMEIAAQFIHYKGKGDEFGERATTWDPYDNPWGLFGFGGRLFLARPGQSVFRFEEYEGFLKGRAGLRGSFTAPMSGGAYFNVTLENVDAPMNTHDILKNTTTLNHEGRLPITGTAYGTGHWFITDNAATEKDGVMAHGFFKTDWSQAFSVRISPYFYNHEMVFLGDLRNLDDIPENAVVRCSLIREDGGIADQAEIPAILPGFEVRLSYGDIPVGARYTAEALLLEGGEEIASVHTACTRAEEPEWLDYQGGVFTEVDPATGWRPLVYNEKDGRHIVKVLENTAVFDASSVLPAAMEIAGEQFAASPMRFRLETDRGEEFFEKGAVTLSEQDGRGVTLLWEGGAASGLGLRAEIRAEFDGLIYYRLALVSDGAPVTIRRAALEFPLVPEKVMYLRSSGAGITDAALIGAGKSDQPIRKIDIPYEVHVGNGYWPGGGHYCAFQWVGNDRGGMYMVLPSERNLAITDRYNELTDEPGKLVFTLNLIDTETTIYDVIDWEFGFIMTPSKRPEYLYDLWKSSICYTEEIRGEGRKLRNEFRPDMKQHPMAGRFWGWENIPPLRRGEIANLGIQANQTQIGNPYPPQGELEFIRNCTEEFNTVLGAGAMLWYDSLFTTIMEPGVAPYAEDIERNPRERLQLEHFGSYTCGSPAWANLYLMGAERFMKMGVRSFYMDMSNMQFCSNRIHGHGWYDAEGGLHPVSNFLDVREMFLRYQHLIKKNDPRAVLMLHGGADTPLLLYCDVTTFGEELSLLRDYSSLSPEYFRIMFSGWKNFGVPIQFFAPLTIPYYGNGPKSTVTYEETWGLSLVHGESVFAATAMHLPSSRLVWDALEAFGVEDGQAEWIPYFRNPRSQYPGGVLVSSFVKDDAEMLVIFNNSYEEAAIPDAVFAGLSGIVDLIGTAPEDKSVIKGRGFYLLKGQKDAQ